MYYNKNSAGNVEVTTTTNLDLDYADVVVVSGTAQSEEQYTYGNVTGTGTFSYDTSSSTVFQSYSTTVGCTRTWKRYTLTINTTNASYGSYSVTRTSSPYGAQTGALSNGATIYYGDVLSGSSSGNGVSYGAWNITSVKAPTVTSSGDATSGNITVTNADSSSVTLYYNTSNAAGGTSLGATASGSSQSKTGLSFGTTYYCSASRSRSRDKYTDTKSSSNYTGTTKVTDNVTASFSFSRTTETDTSTIYSSVTAHTTAAQNSYTITWSYRDSYSSWTTASTSYAYGATPSRTLPSTVTSGGNRYVATSWDNLSVVTGNRTVTAQYQLQYLVAFSHVRCSATAGSTTYTSGNSYWINSGTEVTLSANPNCAFNSSGTTSTTNTINSSKTIDTNENYCKLSSISSTRCTCDHNTTTWYPVGETITWTNSAAGYRYNSSGATTTTSTTTPGGTYTVSFDYYRCYIYAQYGTTTLETKTIYTTSGSAVNSSSYYDTTYYAAVPYYYTGRTAGSVTVTDKDQSCTATYSNRYTYSYTLTISQTGSGNVSVSRTSSPYAGAATGALANGSTIYYGDVLTGSSSGTTTYGSWSVTSVSAPEVSSTGNATSGNITVKNKDANTVTLYYGTSNAYSGTSLGSTATGATQTKNNLSFSTTYYCYAARSRTRTATPWTAATNNYTGTNGVTGNVTATFVFNSGTAYTDNGTCYSSITAHTTAARNSYTITYKRNYYAITGITSKASSVTADTDVTQTKYYGESYSYTYSKTGYDSQTKSGTCTGNTTETINLSPTVYNLAMSATNWTGGWYTSTGYSTAIT